MGVMNVDCKAVNAIPKFFFEKSVLISSNVVQRTLLYLEIEG